MGGGANYLPVFMWVLAALNRLAGGPLTLETVPLVKVAALCFDLGLALAVARLLSARGRNPALALLVMLNPATLYDSWVWGQIDAMHTAFVGGAWLALSAGAPAAAAGLFLLALDTKLQSLAFAPFVGFALLLSLGKSPGRWLRAAGACAAIQLALLVPFLSNPRSLEALWKNLTGIVGYFPVVSLNAYNVWYFLVGDPAETPDSERWAGLSFRTWGVALFALALAVVAVPFVRWLLARRRAGDGGRPRRPWVPLPRAGRALLLPLPHRGTRAVRSPGGDAARHRRGRARAVRPLRARHGRLPPQPRGRAPMAGGGIRERALRRPAHRRGDALRLGAGGLARLARGSAGHALAGRRVLVNRHGHADHRRG